MCSCAIAGPIQQEIVDSIEYRLYSRYGYQHPHVLSYTVYSCTSTVCFFRYGYQQMFILSYCTGTACVLLYY